MNRAAGGDGARRFTEHEGGIFTIQQYRPFCNRIPVGHNRGMTAHKHLSLEVNAAKLFGSSGESMIKTPMDVETHEELSVWIAGLKLGGAGGYVSHIR